MTNSLAARWISGAPYLLSILRIVSAFLFMQYGTTKLFGFPAEVMPGGGTAPPLSLAGIAAILEVVGGALLFVGLFTRSVAFIVSGEMAVAYFMGSAPQGLWPILNQGVPAILFCFLWLYISAAGPGPWSIDAALRRRKAGGTRMSRAGGEPTLRLPPASVVRALWFGVALLVAIGLSAVVGRGVFPGDFATRADPFRQRVMKVFHRQDPLASTRPAELNRFDRRFAAAPFVTMLHILPGGLLMILAPLQFSSRIRKRHIRFHRSTGRLLVGAAVVSALAGLYFGLLMPYGGLGEVAAITLFGGILLVSVIRAVVAVRRGQVARHREWMIRAFAVVLGISMVRVVGPVFDLALTPAGLPPHELFVLSLWTGWTLTLAAGELWIRYTRGARERETLCSGAVVAEARLQ